MLKKLISILLMLALIIGVYIFTNKKNEREEQATILLERIEQVEKLIVVEGHFAEVYTYKQAKDLFFDIIPVEKKVIVVVKAKASVGYDMRKVKYTIDKEKKQVIIHRFPEEEIIIEPEITYYDIQDSQWFKLTEQDYTQINKRAVELIRKQVNASVLPIQAKERLQEVIEQIVFTSEQLNWEVVVD